MVPRNPYPSLEPKTSTWKMLVSIGWFQIFTCKMVVSPFPSIRNRIYPMNTHVKKDVLCLLRGPHPKGFPTILGGLRWSSAHWYGANVGVGASWNSNRSSYKEGQAGWNPKIFSLEYDVVTSLSYVLGLLCFWICRLFLEKNEPTTSPSSKKMRADTTVNLGDSSKPLLPPHLSPFHNLVRLRLIGICFTASHLPLWSWQIWWFPW